MTTSFVPASSTNYTLVGTAEDDILDALTGGGNNILQGGDGNDELFAYTNDKLFGEAGNDELHSEGNGGNTLDGGDGNDIIFADRNDTILGSAGDDTIFGNRGGNTLTGGAGKDTFWLANAEYPNSPNIITDFNPADDNLRIDIDGIKLDKLSFSAQGNDTVISANNTQFAILKDQNYELPIFTITSASAIEGSAIDFTVTRTGDKQTTRSVTVSTSIGTDDTASANDLTAKTEILTFAAGESSKTFTVQTTQDSLFEGNETFTVSLSNPNNGAVVSSTNGTAKGTINNDDAAPIFSIAAASATEGSAVNFTVTRTGDAQSNQSVTVATSIATDDTASANDLTANTQTLTFATGETSKTFTVQTTQDSLFEGNETFTVSLSNPNNGAVVSSTNATAKGTINNDDAAPIFSIAAASATEGSAVNFTVTRTGDAQSNQSVTVATSIATDDTASANDLTANTQTLTFATGETSKTFTVQTTQDSLFEGNETFTVSLSNPNNGAVVSSTNGTAKGTINNDDAAPIFSIAAASATEGSAVNFTVTRTGDAQSNQSVTVATSIATDDTASANDLTANTQTLTFATGETSKTFTVQTTQDSLFEGNETFTVSLSNPNNGAVVSSTNGTAKGTINNDDAAPIFSIAAASATEGSTVNFTVTRTGDAQSNQSVTVATSIATDDTASANDLTANTQTLTFATGETSKTFTVQTTQDSLFEGNETFTVSLSNPNNGAVVSSTNGTAKGTINNDDAAPIFSIAAASATEGSAVNFTVTRTGDAQSNQSVTVATSIATDDTASANDLTANTQTLTFATGETSKTFTVQTTQDSLFEGNETFTVSLSNPNNGAVVSSTNGTAKGTINNDDAAPIFSIAAASATEGSAVNFTVTRTGDAQANQSVTVATSIATDDTASTSDLTANTQTLTFAQGETSKTFTVQTTQDSLFEGNETFTVSLSNPNNGAVVSSTNATAKGTINNDDAAPIFSIAAASATEGSAVNFTVTRTGDAQTPQSVTVATSIATGDTASANDLTAKTETLTFATGETSKTFTVQTTQDSLFEGNETFTVSLSNPNNGAVVSSTNATAKGTINNDDAAPIFSIAAASATEGSAVNFTVTRTGDAQANQSVTVATSIATDDTASTSDLTANTQTLTFAQGETSKTFTVQTTQDSLFEGNETFTVSLSNPNNGAVVSSTNATAKGTINNDDAAPIFSIAAASATEGSAVNFTVTRTGDAQTPQSVTVATSIATDDTASASDLTANTQTLTFAQGETSKTFTVQTTQDSLFEGNETFTVSLSNPNNGAVVSSTNATAKGTINNDDAAPIFSIAAASATEGSAVNFTVTRTGDAQANQNVTIATSIGVGDTASGSDFTTKTETLTFAQGEASKTFTVQTTQDALLEVNETFTVSLSNPTNGAIISSTSGTAKGTIEDSIIKITANTQDGPIVGANVFFDGNFNGIKDGDEPQTTTDSTGNFTLEIIGSYDLNKNGRLDPTEGYYVATGGKDAITGLPFTGNLRAVAGSTVVTPITTLVSSIVDTGVSLEKASTQVKTALGIPDSVDLGTFNPIATENLGSSEAQKVLTAQVGVQAFIGQITTAFASVTNTDRITFDRITFQVTSNLATAVQSTNFNLSDVNQVKSFITNTVNSLKVLDNNLDLAKITTNTEQISQIVSANSQQILTATSISTVFKAQKVAQSDTTQDITAALKGEKSFQDVVARNTGEALKELIAQATIETLVNLEVTPSTVTEDGISNLVYTFTRIGDTANTLTVNYDITGTANSSDYTGAIPGTGKTITFAAGSSKATLTVDPTPDTIIENDETVVLTLATGTGYTVGTSTAVTGTISNINKPPIITSGITFSVLDNTTTVGTVTATDPENQSLTYNLIGGVDQNLFTINATTGALRFKTAPDFKAPSDVGKDNVYDIKVQVTDGSNLVTQDIAIRVVTGMPAPINQAPTNITLQNSITTLSEGTSTTTRLKVADIVITDDGLGSNTISLTGVDATSFEVEETVLYIKKDTKLDYETKNSYGVTVNVDDTTVGNTPDVFTNFTLTVTDVNYAPEVKPNQIFGYTENKTANFQVGTVLATDDIAVTGFAIASGNDSGFFNINNQGIITLTDKGVTSAANDFERSPNSFTLGIIAKDAAEATSQVTNVTINVTNDPTDDNKKPNLQSFTQNGQEDQIISFGIGDFKDKGKYQDEDNNDLMAIKVISLPTAGSLTFVDGQQVTVNQEISVDDLANLRYNPVLNANGNVATLTVAAIDNGTPKVESDPATITINLTPVNDPPVAQNDQLSVSQGSAGTINPLNNDSDPEGDSLKLTGKTDGKYGKVDINGNNLTYTLSDANYLGNDVFSYTVSDGSLSASANVRVTVTGKAATDTVAPTQLIPIAPDDKLIPKEAGTLTGIVDKLGYEFPNNYNPSLVKNSLQNALNQTTAAFNNLFGLYEVDDATGSVNGIKPGETGYAKAALGKVVNNFIARVGGSSSGAASDVVVSGGKIYSPFVIANGGNFSGNLQQAINAFFAANPNNSPATAQNYTTLPVAYFSFGVANPDGAAHLRSFGNNTFGFEDLPAGVGISDYDFNDAVFSFGAIA